MAWGLTFVFAEIGDNGKFIGGGHMRPQGT